MLTTRPPVGVDRLTGPALSNFVPEERGWPADIGVIAILDGVGLFDGDGQLRIAEVRDRIAGRQWDQPGLVPQIFRVPAPVRNRLPISLRGVEPHESISHFLRQAC